MIPGTVGAQHHGTGSSLHKHIKVALTNHIEVLPFLALVNQMVQVAGMTVLRVLGHTAIVQVQCLTGHNQIALCQSAQEQKTTLVYSNWCESKHSGCMYTELNAGTLHTVSFACQLLCKHQPELQQLLQQDRDASPLP